METKPTKQRLTIYIAPSLHRWLWRRRAETDKPVSEIAEQLIYTGIGVESADEMAEPHATTAAS